MKLKFDENISVRIVTAIRALETGSIEIGSVHEDYSQGITDPDWMFRFRDEGGLAMISGDHNILQTPINLAAYTASGLVSIWPPGGWPELKRFGQAAFLIRWWAAIKRKINQSTPGDRWRLPSRGPRAKRRWLRSMTPGLRRRPPHLKGLRAPCVLQ